MIFNKPAIGDASLKMRVEERPCPTIIDPDIESGGQRGDLLALREAAGDDDIRLDDVNSTCYQHIAEAIGLCLVLTAGDAHTGLAPKFGHLANIILRDRLLEEADVIGRQRPGQLHRMEIIEAAIGIDEEFCLRTDRIANAGDAAFVLDDHITQQARLVASLQCAVANRHLQAREAAFHPGFSRVWQFIGFIKAEAECGVDRASFARAAEEPPDRLAKRLALDIPQRHIDGGNGVHADPALPTRHQRPVEPVPDTVIVQRVHAHDGRRCDTLDGSLDRLCRPD